ncbi:fimbrillin family protein [Bacteroides sp.]
MKKMIDKILMAALPVVCLLGSCTREPEEDAFDKGEPVTLQINREPFATADGTRATETDYTTSFATGDRIGVFAVANDGSIWDNNVPYQYDGSTWTPVNSDNTLHCYYYNTVTYLAYYPYSATMDNTGTEDGIVNKFTPQTDQSTKEGYTKSDLMVGTGTLSGNKGNKTLSLTMKHKMAMVEFAPSGIRYITSAGYEYWPPIFNTNIAVTINGSVYTPFSMSKVYRIIAKPGVLFTTSLSYKAEYTASTLLTYTMNSKTMPLTGKYNRYNFFSETPKTRNLQVGDFVFNNGCISPGENLTADGKVPGYDDPTNPCIGVIASTNVTDTKSINEGFTHGYAMGFDYVPGGKTYWSTRYVDEVTENVTKASARNDMNGYNETTQILETQASQLSSYYPAFNIMKTFRDSNPVPEGVRRTPWYIPSIGQWYDIILYLGKTDPEQFNINTTTDWTSETQGEIAFNNINAHLKKVDKAFSRTTRSQVRFWCSTEIDATYCWFAYFGHNDKANQYKFMSMGRTEKNTNTDRYIVPLFSF